MRNISFDLRINFFGGANRIEYEEIPGQGVEDSESFKGISFKRLNHLIKMHLKQVADLNLRLVEVSKPKTIFKKSGIAYTFEEPNNPLSGVSIYIWTEDLDAQNLERLLILGLEINKARRVAMRKLASSSIFDVVVHVKGPGFKRSKAKVGLAISELNKHIEDTFKSIGKSAKELAYAGRILTTGSHSGNFQLEDESIIYPRVGETSRMVYIVKGINNKGTLALQGEASGNLYIEILCDTLDARSLGRVLQMGLGISKFRVRIPTTYSL